jgi:NADPH-dependent 2,4-dienoyl-CoA reductase/sulfur reductase-like enzyme
MTTSGDGIVIAGGGLAAQRCAEALRRHGHQGAIRIACSEVHRPYDRPPLSKQLLTGEHPEDLLPYRPAAWYEQHSIDLLLGVSATALSLPERRLLLSDGTSLRYDKLVIATGSRPRALPALRGYSNVSALRTLDDSRMLRGVLAARPRLAIVGAGFVGLEVAATARKLGVEVTMIEAAPCPLASVLGPPLGGWFARLHRREGVEVITGQTVERARANGSIRALRLSDGRTVPADHVLVGVGVQADTGWLAGSGLRTVAGAIAVDRDGRTGAGDVLAIGDAAATLDPMLGGHVPGSHWEAAGRQAVRAARVMLGLDPGAAPVTSFWTDQYGLRIHYLGHARLADRVTFDGDCDGRSFAATFTRAGRPVAALLVDRPRSLPAARKMIEKGTE